MTWASEAFESEKLELAGTVDLKKTPCTEDWDKLWAVSTQDLRRFAFPRICSISRFGKFSSNLPQTFPVFLENPAQTRKQPQPFRVF